MSIRANSPAQRLDQRITFQRKVQTQNTANGELTPSWQNVATIGQNGMVRAAVDAQKANEIYQSQQIEAEGLYTVIIRWRGDIDSNMRIVWQSRNLDIRSIPDQQKRGRWLFLVCQAGVNDG
jgi:SPP1 family predicted phage head-tail adaptor